MSHYRHALPQLSGELFLTDGGIETTLVYHEGLDLPDFAAFVLLDREEGLASLARYYVAYAELAARYRTGLVLESPTWRASADWGRRLGYSREALADVNRRAMAFIGAFRNRADLQDRPVVLSGNLGPRGDGYVPGALMTVAQAADYHAEQIGVFAGTEADLVTAMTINYPAEAIGIARAAMSRDLPVVISFTVETDGKLPTGDSLQAAIERTDAATDGYPSYYMINCAHPTHFAGVLTPGAAWVSRIRGVRANASRLSHVELDQATTLDVGNPLELGVQYKGLHRLLPGLNVLGGCCGTDHRHVEAMVLARRGSSRTAPA